MATPSHAFYHLGINSNLPEYLITFSVKEEVNIRYYLIEGSNDMVNFDRLTRVYARGQSRLPSSYAVTIRNTKYSCYRVRQVDEDGAAILSNDDIQETSMFLHTVAAQSCAAQAEAALTMSGTHFQGAFF